MWKRCEISIQDGIDNYIETTKIKPNFASLNNGNFKEIPILRAFQGGELKMGIKWG